MLYYLIRPVARYVLRAYYRHIDLTGLEHIPADAAVILAANHPTAFIEPCLLACFQRRPLWFLARGDLFKNRVAIWFLRAVNILPVFRFKDGGYGRLKDNFSTFKACYGALSKRKAIMILAEGSCVHEKNLRPLQRGAARLALGALDRDATLPDVYVVPVGCNFTHPERMRSQVMIRCGTPLLASAYLADYRASEATAVRALTAELEQRLSPLVVQFPDQDRAGLGEARLALDRARHQTDLTYGITSSGEQLDRELVLAATTPPADPPLTRWFNRLDRQGITAAAFLAVTQHGEPATAAVWWRALLGGLLVLPLVPLVLAAEFIAATQPKHVEFYSPVRFAALAGGLLLYVPLVALLTPWWVGGWLLLALVFVRWAIRGPEAGCRQWYRRKVARLTPAERTFLEENLP